LDFFGDFRYTLLEQGRQSHLEADGRLEASKRGAQAKVVLAEASQRAIQKVTEAMRQLPRSGNAKIVVVPADIPAAICGIRGQAGR